AATLGRDARTRAAEHVPSDNPLQISFAPRTAQPLRVLMQLNRTFILASDGDALLLVDQHAAHERIAFETIVAAAASGTVREPLLVPLILELDAAKSAALDGALEAMHEGGLEIEPFGERSYRVIATPAG